MTNIDSVNSIDPIKTDLINHLVVSRKYTRYLEFCTANTGFCYSKINRDNLDISHRMLYRCPSDFEDGLPIDFRTDKLEIAEQINKVKQNGIKYDIILSDPWHEYETSYRDIEVCFDLLKPGGVLVVHDCFPPSSEIVGYTAKEGSWCGVTYKAYIDFVINRSRELKYYTVNIDYGCGLIFKREKVLPKWIYFPRKVLIDLMLSLKNARYRKLMKVISKWQNIGYKDPELYKFFKENYWDLLNLRPYSYFLESEKVIS